MLNVSDVDAAVFQRSGPSQLHYGSSSHSNQLFSSHNKEGQSLQKKIRFPPGFPPKTEKRLERPPKRPHDGGESWSDTSRDRYRHCLYGIGWEHIHPFDLSWPTKLDCLLTRFWLQKRVSF